MSGGTVQPVEVGSDVTRDPRPATQPAWADRLIAESYHHLDKLSERMPSGSTERGLIREAMSKLELADQYVEKREREERDHDGCSICGREFGGSHRENCPISEDEGGYVA